MGAEASQPVSAADAAAGSSEPGAHPDTMSNAADVAANGDEGTAKHPRALVIVGPSGVGKGTLINKLMEGNDSFGFSTSHTTRQPRPGEKVRHAMFRIAAGWEGESIVSEVWYLSLSRSHGVLHRGVCLVRIVDSTRRCIGLGLM